MGRTLRRITALAVVLGASVALAACSSNDTLAQQYRSGDSKNYIAGDGTVTEFAKGNRPVGGEWVGATEAGQLLTNKDLIRKTVVLNFWYAGCAPCRSEIKDLVKLQAEFKSQGVQFVGVNVRDTAATALAFDRAFKVNFPSVMDNDTGAVVLAYTGVVTPQAVPTTLVLDSTGKVTSRILGRIDPSTLKSLIITAVGK
jgi:peroxiredoxin